jgi:hypothetical protein
MTADASGDSLRKGKQELITKSARNVRESAESLAVQALAYIASDAQRLVPFLQVSGIDASAIRAAAASPGFLAGVLDYVAADERLLLGFARDADLGPGAVMQARAVLGGKPWEADTA